MSIFGSRDDDPLLQNDPLAPSSDEDTPADENSPDEEASSDEDPTSGRSSSSNRTPIPETDLAPKREEQESVFSDSDKSRPNGANLSIEKSKDTRILVHSLEATINERLTVLNRALDQGWCLVRVEVRKEESLRNRRPSDLPSVAFVLRRQ